MNAQQRAGFTLLEIMVVVGIIGLLATIATLSYRRAIENTRKRTCAINRNNIDGAKLQWSLENHRPTTEAPADEDLFGENAYIEHKPDCPAGGAYSLNAVREKCTCSVIVHAN